MKTSTMIILSLAILLPILFLGTALIYYSSRLCTNTKVPEKKKPSELEQTDQLYSSEINIAN